MKFVLFYIGMLLSVLLCSPAVAQSSLRETPVVLAVKEVGPAVVNITSTREVKPRFNNTFEDFFFGPMFQRPQRSPRSGRSSTRTSLGSGVIVDGPAGLVLTNAHVIDGGQSVFVHLLDGREFEAQVVGAEPDFDLAVLKIRGAKNLPTVRLAAGDDIMSGETVIAIGNPFGFSHTVTTGVVSGTGRSVRSKDGIYTDLIQTDAAINPGNSGGPLLNILGEVIGINTVIDARAQGIGFAIPISKARRVMQGIIGLGKVSPLWLGIQGQDIDQGLAMALNLKKPQGLLVVNIEPRSPAAKAKLAVGDVILRMGNTQVRDRQDYLQVLRNHTSDTPMELQLWRQGQSINVGVMPETFSDASALALFDKHWGFGVQEARGRLYVSKVQRDGPAHVLEKGDVIVGIGNAPTRTLQEFLHIFRQQRMARQVLVHVERRGRRYYARLTVN